MTNAQDITYGVHQIRANLGQNAPLLMLVLVLLYLLDISGDTNDTTW